jgi:hypothetical protein
MRNRVLHTEEVVRRMFARMKDELREIASARSSGHAQPSAIPPRRFNDWWQ